MTIVYIGLGSNLDQPDYQLHCALKLLSDLKEIRLIKVSSFYCSKPLSREASQPDYLNAVACLDTILNPFELLKVLQAIENKQGRVRGGQQWSSRTLDLDILLYGSLIIDEPNLQIPHRELMNREFVVYPLFEIAPDLILPNQELLRQIVEQCPMRELKQIENIYDCNLSRNF